MGIEVLEPQWFVEGVEHGRGGCVGLLWFNLIRVEVHEL